MDKIRWCLKIKEGIKIRIPSKEISESYLKNAKSSLKSAEIMFQQNDLLWTSVMVYYADYYALYSFLSLIGIKSENHSCSILLAKLLLGKERIKDIEKHREKRIDSQYYLKTFKKEEIKSILNESKFFVNRFEDFVNNLSEKEIKKYLEKIHSLMK